MPLPAAPFPYVLVAWCLSAALSRPSTAQGFCLDLRRIRLSGGMCCKQGLWCCRYVYQKAYVEFFVSPEKLDSLEQRLQKQSSITYMAINSKGKVRKHWKLVMCLSDVLDARHCSIAAHILLALCLLAVISWWLQCSYVNITHIL